MGQYTLGLLAPIDGTAPETVEERLKRHPHSCTFIDIVGVDEQEYVLFKLRGQYRNRAAEYASKVSDSITSALVIEVNNTTDEVWVGCYGGGDWAVPTHDARGTISNERLSSETPIEEAAFKTVLEPESDDIKKSHGTLSSYFELECGISPPLDHIS